MTRLYISGPMTGQPDLNRLAFHNMEQWLREQGVEGVNPHGFEQSRLRHETLSAAYGTHTYIITSPTKCVADWQADSYTFTCRWDTP